MRFRLTSFHKKSAFSATAHSENSESGRLSYFIQFFVWFHIVCDRYASDHAHFTFFNLIWPLSLSWVFEIQTNGYTEKLSYLFIGNAEEMLYISSTDAVCYFHIGQWPQWKGRLCKYMIRGISLEQKTILRLTFIKSNKHSHNWYFDCVLDQ